MRVQAATRALVRATKGRLVELEELHVADRDRLRKELAESVTPR